MQPTNNQLGPRGIVLRDTTYKATQYEELKKLTAQIASGQVTGADVFQRLTRKNVEVSLDKWITNDPAMLRLKSKVIAIQKNSSNHDAVLITGPSGTGKELIARAIGDNDEPFVARNCAGIPKELIASIFFGHLRGTFTGADSDRQGILVQAKAGVVFLDEIGDMPLELQAMLLRAIQEREVCRLGAVESIPIACRFVAATKFDLREQVEKGLFREDLFARLFTHELRVTGLESRKDDIPLIAAKGLDTSGNPLNWTEPIPDSVLPDIYRFNVRGIQTFVRRYKTYGFI